MLPPRLELLEHVWGERIFYFIPGGGWGVILLKRIAGERYYWVFSLLFCWFYSFVKPNLQHIQPCEVSRCVGMLTYIFGHMYPWFPLMNVHRTGKHWRKSILKDDGAWHRQPALEFFFLEDRYFLALVTRYNQINVQYNLLRGRTPATAYQRRSSYPKRGPRC